MIYQPDTIIQSGTLSALSGIIRTKEYNRTLDGWGLFN
jgi:hypothetical protein